MEIIAVYGMICSGKTTFLEKHSKDCLVIEIGDIVRQITQTDKRIHNRDLDKEIIVELLNKISLASPLDYEAIFVSGIRQMSIVQALEKFIERDHNFELENILLTVPHSLSRQRYENRTNKPPDSLSWIEAIMRDNKIGLVEVLKYIETNRKTVIFKTQSDDKEII